jgi:hypothetical protein
MRINTKSLSIVSACIAISFSGLSQAHAAQKTTILENFVQINYSDSIKLKSKGCQELKFNYIIDDNLPLEKTVFIIQLVHKSKKIIYGYGFWFSDIDPDDGLPSMSRIGTIPMKICRNNWQTKSDTGVTKYTGVKPGDYDLYFAYGYYDKIDVTDKKVIRQPIKLLK